METFHFRIESVNYDGSCRKVITSIAENAAPFALTFYENSLYWSNWRGLSLEKFDIKKNVSSQVSHYSSRSFGVKIFAPRQSCKYKHF